MLNFSVTKSGHWSNLHVLGGSRGVEPFDFSGSGSVCLFVWFRLGSTAISNFGSVPVKAQIN